MQNRLTNIDVENFLQACQDTSKLEFIDEGKAKKDLIESAKKRGILIEGSRDLGVLKSVFLFTDVPNANGAIIPSKEFQKIFPQIIGKPMNIGHSRRLVVGFYIDYKYIIKENKAIVYAVFFKSNFPELYEQIRDLQKKNKLSSSFEIWSNQADRKYNSDGSYSLNKMELSGGALILEINGELPAFKNAKVLALAKKENLNEYVIEQSLVFASKYRCVDVMTSEGQLECSKCGRCEKNKPNISGENYFEDNVKENVEKLKKEIKTEEPEKKLEQKIEEPKTVEAKIKCSNCSEEIDSNGVDVRIKCPKCFAILNKEGVMQHPPQIKDFQILCPSCKVGNWLILSKNDKEAKLRCQSCAKEYKVDFVQTNIDTKELLSKFNFMYSGSASCPQCNKQISISGASSLENRIITCPKCKVEFAFNITHEAYKKISKIEEIKIDKIEKSAKTEKGGKEMDYKLEISKFHRCVDTENFEEFEKSLSDGFDKIEEAAVLTTEQRNALPDSDFAVVVRVKDKKTGKTRKVRMFPINDEAHVRNAMARLGQPAPQATLKKLGVSVESVKAKILRRATQLKMTQMVEKYKNESKNKVDYSQVPTPVANCIRQKIKDGAKFGDAAKSCWAEYKKTQPKEKAKPKANVELKVEKKAEKKVEATTASSATNTKVTKVDGELTNAQKVDLALYELENKLAKYAKGIRKLAARIRSEKKTTELAKAEKDKEIKFYKENAKKIYDRREELKDYAKDLSDEDIINEDKFEKAQLKKQLAEAKKIETATENVGDKVINVDERAAVKSEINKNAFPEEGKKQ